MRLARSLRAQLALGAAILALVVVATAGLIITIALDAQDRAAVDGQLGERAARVQTDVPKMLLETNGSRPADRSSGDDYGGLLDSSGSLVRLIEGSAVLVERGDIPAGELPVPGTTGLSTVSIDGSQWRSLTVNADGGGNVRLQVLQDLGPIVQRLDDNRRLVAVITVVATIVAAVGGWLVASVVTRPLRHLRDGARMVRSSAAAEARLPVPRSPLEVHDLAMTLNGMLAQIETSMATARRFTADAGHELRTPLASLGTYLETIASNPGLSHTQIDTMVQAMVVEHGRITSLLDGLQALARGDAGAIPVLAPVDVAELTRLAVDDARRRHPTIGIDLRAGSTDEAIVVGWSDGLRMAITNLVDNAALHGRPDGQVVVGVVALRDQIAVEVSDDGPGIPLELRGRVVERFARGPDVRADGTGLGLSLVSQQAAIHGGSLTLHEAPGGGLLARLTLPRSMPVIVSGGGSPVPVDSVRDGSPVSPTS